MFADDTKIYEMINTEADASAMENDLANFQSSSANANLILINVRHYILLENSTKRSWCLDLFYLRLVQTSLLPMGPKQQVTWLYSTRSTIKTKTISVRRTLYLTLVCSHLAYAFQVWAPQSVSLIMRTERIQRHASKYTPNSINVVPAN